MGGHVAPLTPAEEGIPSAEPEPGAAQRSVQAAGASGSPPQGLRPRKALLRSRPRCPTCTMGGMDALRWGHLSSGRGTGVNSRGAPGRWTNKLCRPGWSGLWQAPPPPLWDCRPHGPPHLHPGRVQRPPTRSLHPLLPPSCLRAAACAVAAACAPGQAASPPRALVPPLKRGDNTCHRVARTKWEDGCRWLALTHAVDGDD